VTRLLHHSAAPLLLLAAAAPALAAQSPRAVVRFRAFPTPVVLDTLAVVREVTVPTGWAFAAARQAMADLGLRPAVADSVRGVIGHLRWTHSGPFAGEQASTFVNCGHRLSGPIADRDRLTLAWVALLDPAGPGRTRIRLSLIGEALDVTGASTRPAACHSTGHLEQRLAERIAAYSTAP